MLWKMLSNIFDNLDFLPFQFCWFVLLPRLEPHTIEWKRKKEKVKKAKKEKKKIVKKICTMEIGDVTRYAQTYVMALQECKVT